MSSSAISAISSGDHPSGGTKAFLPPEGGSHQPNTSSQDKVRLKKKVTLLRGISIIIGTIIGAGIFITPKGILQHTGTVGMALVMWTACGILSLFGALCYAELGTSIKKSGAHYTYILEAFGPLPAFIRVWVELIVIRPAATAVISLAFGQYILEPFFMPCGIPEIAIKLVTTIGITLSVRLLASLCWNMNKENCSAVTGPSALPGLCRSSCPNKTKKQTFCPYSIASAQGIRKQNGQGRHSLLNFIKRSKSEVKFATC